jgi:hypothetical protein
VQDFPCQTDRISHDPIGIPVSDGQNGSVFHLTFCFNLTKWFIVVLYFTFQTRKSFMISLDFVFQADKLAAGLLKLGLEPGDRLGIWSTNSSEVYLTFLAAMRAGLIAVS